MSYRLRLCPYSGGHLDLAEGDKATCRQRAARKIRYHRNRLEYPVSVLEPGNKWELESDPEGYSMIGDNEGILVLEEIAEDDSAWDEEEFDDE
jgi:hypothetical protein